MARPQKADPELQGLGGRANQQTERKKWLVYDFETMDTEPARVALNPKRLAWCENALIIANNELRAVPGLGSTLATLTGQTITKRFFAFVAGVDYLICFTAAGNAYAVNQGTGAVTNFASGFSSSPDLTQWEDKRILIADPTKGYCTWDGTLFVTYGNVSPNIVLTGGGDGYLSPPTVTITGGAGSGQTAAAVMENDTVASVDLVTAGTGFNLGDTGTLLVKFTGGNPTAGGVVGAQVLFPGIGYTSAPTVTIAAPAGGGTTATATATVSLGKLISIAITLIGSGYKETPTITLTGGGATAQAVATPIMETVASATVDIWPLLGFEPKTLDIFQGRVWIGSGRTIQYTGTGPPLGDGSGYDDFNEANAAGEVVLTDADVVHSITKLKSANNFLFIVCDQSIKQIGQVSVVNGRTEFAITALSSDQGTTYPDTVKSYNRSLVFANETGLFGVFGASVEKLSAPMTGIIEKTDFSLAPIVDVIDFFGHHVLLMLVRYLDPNRGARSLLLAYYSKRWSVISMGDSITGIITAHLAGPEKIYSTEGAVIKQILADLNVTVDILIKTALAHDGAPMINKRGVRVAIGQTSGSVNTINVTLDSENGEKLFSYQAAREIIWVNDSGDTITWINNSGDTITWINSGYFWYETLKVNQSGIYLGLTLSGTVKDYRLHTGLIEYTLGPLMKSRNV